MKKSLLQKILILSFIIASINAFPIKAPLAQDILPSMHLYPDMVKPDIIPMPELDMKFNNWDNSYLGDILMLQYQVGLLQQMIEWQSEINRMSQTYMKLGIPFTRPKPPQRACKLLPYNIPCFYAYPEIDADLPLGNISQEKSLTSSKNNRAINDNYKWTNVSCASKICKAVIVSDKDKSYRRVVLENDTLENGSVVVSISVDGVKVKEKDSNKIVSLPIAPNITPINKQTPQTSKFEPPAPAPPVAEVNNEIDHIDSNGKDVISYSKSDDPSFQTQDEISDFGELLDDMPDF